jgi:hypothetical protein
MSTALARAVAELEGHSSYNEVTHLRQRFDPDTADLVWIPALAGEREWIIISGDPHITRNPAERAAWRESGLTAYFLKPGWASQPLWTYASRFIAWWPQVTAHARRTRRGDGFLVPFKGSELEKVER